jgi:hypothetical protein
MKWLRLTFLVGLAGGFTAGFVSCDTADAFFDCQSVCSRYKDCFNKDYDVATCRSNCRTRSDNDSTFRAKADACESCIDDRSCTAATFACGVECSGIVP